MFEQTRLPDGSRAIRHYLGTDQPEKPCARCGQDGPMRYFFVPGPKARPLAACRLPGPAETGPLTACGPCGKHVLTAELPAKVLAEE